MFDSDGNCISVLEKLLGEKREKRTWYQKYICCCLARISTDNICVRDKSADIFQSLK